MTTLREDLIDLIAGEALVDKARLTPAATLTDAGLDSVGVVSVIFAVEEKYGVELPEDAFAEVANFRQFLDIIVAAIQAKSDA